MHDRLVRDSHNPFAYLQLRDDVCSCCKLLINLEIQQCPGNVLRARCRTCGRGHIKMVAEGFKLSQALKQFAGPTQTTESGLIVPRR